ncbi:MAG: ATP-binding cassette domain-containing protein [Bacteroidota bacterium]|nr:ATP-binding cassette domain-containing protein [Candidatus Kapabacteria bacterium]MCS7302627.1 ATP-binding cassette domain-containing protein [Candidatus Kapabacteria bacterium]MCX7936258.1 ATP-binding cassette domain-containing protein [Chlorobiota bacterium]MDW8074461.1 ATP-binding cassette domain-containing protein [Bacteroidota bacterium]MDW8271063.1 ATP-binding cassette domain-containing protein [Bacteroidota bacterium]
MAKKTSPTRLLFDLVELESRDISLLIGYGILVSIFSLSVPLAVDLLVTTIAAGTVTLPLIVVAVGLTVLLAVSGLFGIVQLYVAELIERRIFVRTTCQAASTLWETDLREFEHTNVLSLLNRFFDVVNVQKVFTKLTLDAITAALSILVGLVFMAIFSSLLWGLTTLLVTLTITLIVVAGYGGVVTNIAESDAKYALADALDEVGVNIVSYKVFSTVQHVIERFESPLQRWLQNRKAHFRIIVRQQIVATALRIVMIVTVLLVGGFLVIDRQISLGQLVASEIIILLFLSSIENIIKQIPSFFTLLTSLSKLEQLTSLRHEHNGAMPFELNGTTAGLKVEFVDVAFSYRSDVPLLRSINLTVNPGERLCIVGTSGCGKSTLGHLMLGLLQPQKGSILINDYDTRLLDRTSFRNYIGYIKTSDEIINGTILDNIIWGRSWISQEDVRWALELTMLDRWLNKTEQGVLTPVGPRGGNLSTGQIRRIMIARAIVHRPRLLIIDEGFNGIEDNVKLTIVKRLYDKSNPWTVVTISHDPEVVIESETVAVLHDGYIIEHGPVARVARHDGSMLQQLFPTLNSLIKQQ